MVPAYGLYGHIRANRIRSVILLAGSFREATLVDNLDAKLWVFDPIRGTAYGGSS